MTPDLAPPFPGRRDHAQQSLNTFQDTPYGQRIWMLECATATRGWRPPSFRLRQVGELPSCGRILSPDRAHLCWVPNGFRTNFRPRTQQEDADSGIRHRSIQAEGKALEFRSYTAVLRPREKLSVALAFDARSRTYRLNRGPEHEGSERGFNVRRVPKGLVWGKPSVQFAKSDNQCRAST